MGVADTSICLEGFSWWSEEQKTGKVIWGKSVNKQRQKQVLTFLHKCCLLPIINGKS